MFTAGKNTSGENDFTLAIEKKRSNFVAQCNETSYISLSFIIYEARHALMRDYYLLKDIVTARNENTNSLSSARIFRNVTILLLEI